MIRRNAHALNFLSRPPHERVIQFLMAEILCPRCGREALGGRGVWSSKKPYCSACGWNVDRANTLGGKNQKLLAVYFIAIALFLVGLGFAPGGAARRHPGSVMAFAFIVAVLAAISWHRSKAQRSIQAAPAVAPPPASVFPTTANPGYASYERLTMLRRPRAIRLKTHMRIFAIVYSVVLGSVVYAAFLMAEKGVPRAGSYSVLPNILPLAMFGLIWSIAAFTMFRTIARDRSLLTEGEIAIATVTSQSYAGGENRESRIAYEFKDAAGRTVSGKCADRTRKLFEEMQTPVFYDPLNPARNVALAGATYDVVDS